MVFGPKTGVVPKFFFLGKLGKENVFYDILERKTAFLRYKNNKFKKSKNKQFSKGVNPLFWSKKRPFFRPLFFSDIRPKKMFFTIFQKEKTPVYAVKRTSSKSRNSDIFPNGLTNGFALKIAIFSTFFSFAFQARNMCFTTFQNEKTPFLGYKKKKFKKAKN